MTPRVDIGLEAVELLAASYEHEFGRRDGGVPATLRALRDALDATELEREGWRDTLIMLERQKQEALAYGDAASADGYARGVRDVAASAKESAEAIKAGIPSKFAPAQVFACKVAADTMESFSTAVLALLPADEKETNDGH